MVVVMAVVKAVVVIVVVMRAKNTHCQHDPHRMSVMCVQTMQSN